MKRRSRRKAARREKPAAAAGRGRSRTGQTVIVTDEEREHLIEDVAYFHAARFRPVAPGSCREEDLSEAEAEIRGVIEQKRGP
jgi:hypothetical protein